MKITIKIPFYERFHLMLFVYRENRGNDGYHAQTNKRGETWAGCLQIMMIILQNDLSKIFSWPEGGWITRPNYPPIDMNYIFTGQHPQSYPPYLKRLKTKCSVFIFYLIFIYLTFTKLIYHFRNNIKYTHRSIEQLIKLINQWKFNALSFVYVSYNDQQFQKYKYVLYFSFIFSSLVCINSSLLRTIFYLVFKVSTVRS